MYTRGAARLGIPRLRMSDGPHGLRVQAEGGPEVAGSLPATAFPTAATVANSWDLDLSFGIGAAIGREARRYGVHVVLGPGVNIKRNPAAGRNFEYFSEDALLAGEMAAAEVRGIQSEGVGATVKHFALNNAENFRFMGDSVADMRAIRELYLKAFEIVVKGARPAAVMCAYNKINGEYCSQNRWLLTDVLRGEWGFDGLVMTDWGAMHDRVASLRAGLDLEMPGDTAVCRRRILDAVKDGTLAAEELDGAVKNVLALTAKYAAGDVTEGEACDFAAHDRLAREAAANSAVLLQNDGVLPLREGEEVFVCGELFEKMRYQGAGSSMIEPFCLTPPRQAFDEAGIRYAYARGYDEGRAEADPALLAEAVETSKGYKTAVVFAGLTDLAESEGRDRDHLRLPESQLALVGAMLDAGKQVVVVLFGGAPVELPFAGRAAAVLAMYLPGQCGGRACTDLLFGRAAPSGRLAETWPLRYEDVPFADAFGKSETEVYKESVFVGYRYYSTAAKAVRYPFGHGLTYTRFCYADMRVQDDGETFTVSCTVTNAGGRDGAEVVQLYVAGPAGGVFKPARELRAFRKVHIPAGGSARVQLAVARRSLRYFDVNKGEWVLEGGEYRLQLCADSLTVLMERPVRVEGARFSPYGGEVARVYGGARLDEVTDALFEEMSGRKIPPPPAHKPITLESRFSYLADAGLLGKLLHAAVLGMAKRQRKAAMKLPAGKERDNKIKAAYFLQAVLESNSLLSMTMCAGRAFPYNFAEGFMHLANGHIGKAIVCFCKKIKAPVPEEKKGARKEKKRP